MELERVRAIHNKWTEEIDGKREKNNKHRKYLQELDEEVNQKSSSQCKDEEATAVNIEQMSKLTRKKEELQKKISELKVATEFQKKQTDFSRIT